jgi:hypothetical protein
VTGRSFSFLIDEHRNPRVWEGLGPERWRFKGWSFRHPAPAQTEAVPPIDFTENDALADAGDEHYVVIGKGYPR